MLVHIRCDPVRTQPEAGNEVDEVDTALEVEQSQPHQRMGPGHRKERGTGVTFVSLALLFTFGVVTNARRL